MQAYRDGKGLAWILISLLSGLGVATESKDYTMNVSFRSYTQASPLIPYALKAWLFL